MVTTLITLFSTSQIHNDVAAAPAGQQADILAQFTTFLQAVGTSTFGSVVDSLDAALVAQFGAAYADGLASAIAVIGGVTVIASVVAWLGMGRSEAVVSVWEHRDERAAGGVPAGSASTAEASS